MDHVSFHERMYKCDPSFLLLFIDYVFFSLVWEVGWRNLAHNYLASIFTVRLSIAVLPFFQQRSSVLFPAWCSMILSCSFTVAPHCGANGLHVNHFIKPLGTSHTT